MLRYAAFDLDGTLLDDAGRLLPGVVDGIRRLRLLGLLPIIATGRSPAGFAALEGLADLLSCCDPEVLLYDGDLVLDGRTGVIRCEAALPDDCVVGAGDRVSCVDGRLIASSRRAQAAFAMAFQVPRESISIGVADGMVCRVFHFGAVVPTPPPGVHARCLSVLDAVVWQPQDRGKAVAVAARVARDGYDLGSVLAVGDGDNDTELLERSAVGVAVAGASEAAMAAATVRLTSSVAGYLMTFDKEAHVR